MTKPCKKCEDARAFAVYYVRVRELESLSEPFEEASA